MNHIVIFLVIIILLFIVIFGHSRKSVAQLRRSESILGRFKTIYFAGPLFNAQELIGNEVIADAIEKQSGGRYKIVLPQRLEQTKEKDDPTLPGGPLSKIRNNDIINVLDTDGLILNVTGSEVDSGAVVEFMISKFMAKPALILKGDVRGFGTNSEYNLMLSNYPTTEVLILDTLELYKSVNNNISEMTRIFVERIISSLDKSFERPALEPIERDRALRLLGVN